MGAYGTVLSVLNALYQLYSEGKNVFCRIIYVLIVSAGNGG